VGSDQLEEPVVEAELASGKTDYCASKQDKDLKKREQKSIFLLTKRDQNCFLKLALLELCEQRKE
jgi:hypothetical protein